METTLRFREQLKVEMDSPPLSPRSSDDEDETDPDDSDGDEVEGGDGAGIGTAVVSGPPLKKGPWTPDEDKRLRTYVEANGEGNWNHVQRNAGLNRCGKSCRLRWANHLRPHLKKGPFSEEEELKIIELHAMHGNKWAMMANQLPGRTDNEIKNFWNTRSKRRAKAGLGLYPDGLLSRVQNQDMDSHSPGDLHGKKRPNELSQGSGLVFDDIIFEKLDYKKRAENFLAPPSMIQDSLPLDAMNPLNRHACSDMVSGYGTSPTCGLFPHEPEMICYTNICLKNESVPFNNAIANGPPALDGFFSTSGTIQRPMKMEPPSFQNTSCELSYPGTPLCDNLISSPASVLTKPDYFPSQNNVLLDAMVQQGHVPGYEASVPPVVYFSSHPSVLDDNLFEDGPFNEFKTSKSSASLDTFWVDNHLLPLIDHCINDASTEVYSNESSSHSEYQPINQSMKVMFYGNYCDEIQLSAPGDGHSLELESVPWNSMPGARHLSESSNVSQQQL